MTYDYDTDPDFAWFAATILAMGLVPLLMGAIVWLR